MAASRFVVPAGTIALAVLLGVLRGSLAVAVPGPGTIDGNFGSRPVVLLGVVRSADPGRSQVIVDASHLSDSDSDRSVSGGVLVSGPLVPALSPGDRVEIDASGLHPLDRRPGANSEATLEREGVDGVASSPQVFVLSVGGPSLAGAISWAQGELTGAVDREVPAPGAALLLGIAFGIHQPLAADVRAPLQDAGLIHIVVVSGVKVAQAITVRVGSTHATGEACGRVRADQPERRSGEAGRGQAGPGLPRGVRASRLAGPRPV
jgi:hypothetical protein